MLGGSTTTDYQYDLAGRLWRVHEGGVLVREYLYDANGNRTSFVDHEAGGATTAATADDQDRLATYGTLAFTYTAAGDLLTRTDTATSETTTYATDALGNLVQADLPDGRTISYVIDGQNRRVGKRINGVPVQGWLYQDQLNPVAEVGSLASGVALLVMAGFLVSAGVDRLSVGVASVVSFAVLINWVAIAIGRRRIRLSPSGSAGAC